MKAFSQSPALLATVAALLLLCSVPPAESAQEQFALDKVSPETREAIEQRTAKAPMTLEELVMLMRPDERAAYLRNMADRGLFPVLVPDFFDAVDDEDQKIRFLRRLREPISDEMLAKIDEQLSKDPSDELLLQYGAILYRYRYPSGLDTLAALLERNARVSHIFAINREQSQEEAVAKALISEADDALGRPTYIALGRWSSPEIQAALAKIFAVQRTDISIALALGNSRNFFDEILRLFQEAKSTRSKIDYAAALARMAPNREDNPWLEFLLEEFFAEREPASWYPVRVSEALGYSESRRADALLSEILSDTPPATVKLSDVADDIKREAILALAHRVSSGAEVDVDWPRVLSDEHQFGKGDRELLVSLLPAETKEAGIYAHALGDRIRASKLRLLPDSLRLLSEGVLRE